MAIVELALVIFPLTMIVLGAIDIGVRASDSNRLRAAAREGAAVAQYTPCSDEIEERIRAHSSSFTARGIDITVSRPGGGSFSCPGGAPGPDEKVEITVSTTQRTLSPLSSRFLNERVEGRTVVVVQG